MDIFKDVHGIIQRLKAPSTYEETIAPVGHEGRWNPKGAMSLYDMVDSISKACEAEACAIGVPVVIAIVDHHGDLIHLRRMEDSLLVSLELAPSKAYTAVAFKCNTNDLGSIQHRTHPLHGIENMVKRPIVLFGGGVPLYENGIICGGLGISGGTVEEDMRIAEAGASIIKGILNEV